MMTRIIPGIFLRQQISLFCTVLLIGCTRTSIASTPPRTSQAPSTIGAPSTTPSFPERNTPTRTPDLPNTPIATRISSPTPTPTSTQIPSLPTYPAAPTPISEVIYSFTPPDPIQLVSLININRDRYLNNYYAYDQYGSLLLWRETAAIDGLIFEDIQRFYPNGVPQGSSYLQTRINEWQGLHFGPSKSVELLLIHGFVQLINEQGIQLMDDTELSYPTFEGQVLPLNFGRDGVDRWLVDLDFFHYGVRIFVPLEALTDGRYTIIPNDIPIFDTRDSNTSVEITTSEDLSNDGRAEILIAYRYYLAGSVNGQIRIYTWDGEKIRYLDSVALPSVVPRFGELNASTYDIADYDGDGRSELRVTWPRFRPFNCQWETITQVEWLGQVRIETIIDEEIPPLTECLIAKALENQDLASKVQYFTAALNTLDPSGITPDLRAWVMVQQAVAKAGQGLDQEAEKIIAAIQALSGDGGFIRSVQEIINTVGTNPVELCWGLFEYTQELNSSGEFFESEIDFDLGFNSYYPLYYEPIPEMVCPYWELLSNRIKATDIGEVENPIAKLAELGFSVSKSLEFNLDSDAPTEWIVILDVKRPMLVVLDRTIDGWKAYPIQYLDPVRVLDGSITRLEAAKIAPDVSGETLNLLSVVSEESPNEIFEICQTRLTDYKFFIFGSDLSNLDNLEYRILPCQEDFSVDISDKETQAMILDMEEYCVYCNIGTARYEGNDDFPGWFLLDPTEFDLDAVTDVFQYINTIQGEIISGGDLSQLRSDLHHLLAYLPKTDPRAEALRPRLSYLVGLTYELEGNTDQAVSEYVQLISAAPNSVWSWLAWTRITPNPIDLP